MKKIYSLLLIFSFISGFIPKDIFAVNNTGYYVVTAYYSPLPNQKYYLTGNYESEKRLNGQGIAGASGKPVFSGMLAGPRTYAFGTKIYIEGLGVGEIADRGGAIVSAGNRGYTHDRLDVWVGYGDEGLQRALYWGKRTVKGHIVDSSTKVSIDYKSMYAPEWATSGLQKQNTIFDVSLGKGSNSSRVKELQDFFKNLGIYNGEIDGIYNDEITSIVFNFQIENEIVSSKYDAGAGYWGVKTRDAFKKAYLNGDFDKSEENINSQEQPHPNPPPGDSLLLCNSPCLLIGEGMEGNTSSQPSPFKEKEQEQKIVSNLNIFDIAVSGIENIKKLQEILVELGLYDGEITGIYSDIEENIYNYQLENNIVSSKSTPGAGNFGPKTRASLKETYLDFLKEKEEQEKILKEQEKRKQELEEKYRELEKYALEKATSRTNNFGVIREGEVSQNVRELQLILKDLGYFSEKDTAFFGPKTKEAVISFQLDFDLIDSLENQFAGVVGQRMVSYLNSELANIYLKQKLEKTEIDLDELASVVDLEQLF